MSDDFDFWEKLANNKKSEEDLQAKYKILFRSDIGKDVLSDLLTRLKFGCYLETEADLALHNKAVEVLAMLGIISPGRERDLIDALFTIDKTGA